jgi:hypothetical protein
MTVPGCPFSLILLAILLAAAAPPVEPVQEKDRKVCRKAERQTGSHIRTPHRCRTVEEWQKLDQAKADLPLSAQIIEGQGDALQGKPPQ